MTMNGHTVMMGRAQREAATLRYLRERRGQVLAVQDVAAHLGMPASTVHTMIKRWMADPSLEITKPRRGLVLAGRADEAAAAPPVPAGPERGEWELIEHLGVTSTGRALVRTETGVVYVLEPLK